MKPKLTFYDLKKKKKFETNKYKVVQKSGRYFVKTIAPSGIESWRIISKENAKKWK